MAQKTCKQGHVFDGERCKVCAKISRAQYYQANSDRLKQAAKTNRLAKLDQYKDVRKRYYAENRTNLLSKERIRLEQKPWKYLCKYARLRAKKLNLPFDLTEDYVASLLPHNMLCPVIHIPLVVSKGCIADGSMTIDRINPSLGYVRGNVAIISKLANSIKNDCTDPAILYSMADWLEAQLGSSSDA